MFVRYLRDLLFHTIFSKGKRSIQLMPLTLLKMSTYINLVGLCQDSRLPMYKHDFYTQRLVIAVYRRLLLDIHMPLEILNRYKINYDFVPPEASDSHRLLISTVLAVEGLPPLRFLAKPLLRILYYTIHIIQHTRWRYRSFSKFQNELSNVELTRFLCTYG